MVVDLFPGPDSGLFSVTSCTGPGVPVPGFFLQAGDGELFFSADDGITGPELWRTDGTLAGTRQVADIRPGSAGGFRDSCGENPRLLEGGVLYFLANDGALGLQLWQTTVASGDTAPIAGVDLIPGFFRTPILALVAVGETIVFDALTAELGSEPWRVVDGEVSLLVDIFPGPYGSQAFFRASTEDIAYFTAISPDPGVELWRTDGTVDGTRTIDNLDPDGVGANVSDVAIFDGSLFFSTRAHGLFRTIGADDGFELLRNFELSPFSTSRVTGLARAGDALVFFVREGGPYALWRTDGTSAGTREVVALPFTRLRGEVSSVGDSAVFVAADDAGREFLWRTDGTASGTEIVLETVSAPGRSGIRWRLPSPAGLLFAARTEGDAAPRLWITDGSAEGTRIVGPLCPDETECRPIRPSLLDSTLFYGADDGVHGRELWALEVPTISALPIPVLGARSLLVFCLALALCGFYLLRRSLPDARNG